MVDKKGNTRDVYININGRVGYVLAPGQDYPAATNAKILSIAVSSLETNGISCINVGVSALNVEDSKLTQYVIDTRKAPHQWTVATPPSPRGTFVFPKVLQCHRRHPTSRAPQ